MCSESHPGCRCSRKCIPWMEAGWELQGRSSCVVSEANKPHLENNASQIHNRLPASSKAALDSSVIFLNLYKHLVSLSQTNRTLFFFFLPILQNACPEAAFVHSGIKFELPRVGTLISKTNKANAMSTQSTKSKFRSTDNRTTRPEVVTQGSFGLSSRSSSTTTPRSSPENALHHHIGIVQPPLPPRV